MQTVRRSPAVLLLVLLVALAGCAKHVVIHPGAANAFDSSTYDTLITVGASLETAKTLEPQFPQFKPQLNQAIASYNAARSAYVLYHTAAVAGGDVTQKQAALATQVVDLVSSTAALLKSFGVTP